LASNLILIQRGNFIMGYSEHFVSNKILTFKAWSEITLKNRERRVWFWPFKWYLSPYAFVWSEDDIISEWDKFHNYVSREYPIQHFIRNILIPYFYLMSRYYHNIKTWVKCLIRNPRKEMRNKVFPRRRNDLGTIIVDFCLETIIEYVDRERCFDNIVWDGDEEHIQRAQMIKEIYAYAKTGRKVLLKNIDNAYSNVSSAKGLGYKRKYAEVSRAEKDLNDADTKYCRFVIENRDHLWT
jgi:hypothetical protein